MLAKRVGLADPVDADHEAEAAGVSCADARERVLEDRRLRRLHPEPLRGDEIRVRSRLPAQMLPLGDDAVDP